MAGQISKSQSQAARKFEKRAARRAARRRDKVLARGGENIKPVIRGYA